MSSLYMELQPAEKILKQCYEEILEESRWDESQLIALSLEPKDSANNLLVAKELVNRINSLSIGESCLVPLNIPGHSTLLRIEKAGEKVVRMLYYNTGLGLDLQHAEGIKPNTYQTYIEYDKVPLDNLQDLEKWLNLLMAERYTDMSPQRNMSTLYANLQKFGGIKLPASKYPEYYTSPQVGNSCAYQCFLAMIRERVISSYPNPGEGLAAYKIIKGMLHNAFEKRSRGLIDKTIDQHLQAKIKAVGAELNIANALVDLVKRDTILKKLDAELRAQNLGSLAEELEKIHAASPLEFFKNVKKAINKLERLDIHLMQEFSFPIPL